MPRTNVNYGKHQRVVLNAIRENGGSFLEDLELKLVPDLMNLREYDTSIGALIRKNAISIHNSDEGLFLSLKKRIPNDLSLTERENNILKKLSKRPHTYEEICVYLYKKYKVSQKSIDANLTILRNKCYIESGRQHKNRSVEITERGRWALGITDG